MNLIWLFVLYFPRESSFISTQFFVLYLEGCLVYCLIRLLFFDILLLYYCINLNSSIISCFSTWDICLSFGFSVSLLTVSRMFILCLIFCKFFNNFVANQITYCFCCLSNFFFWSIFKCICGWLFSMIKTFLAKFTA